MVILVRNNKMISPRAVAILISKYHDMVEAHGSHCVDEEQSAPQC